MVQNIKLYARMMRMHALSKVQYHGWWLMVLTALFVVLTDPLSTFLMFDRFGSIGVWTVERIMLIYSLAVTAFCLAETLMRGFDVFPWKMIRSGEFDRLLLRPRSLAVQVAGLEFTPSRLGRFGGGMAFLLWSLHRLGVSPSPRIIIILFFALAGGFLTYAGVFILCSGLAFFTVKGLDWIYILTNASYQVTRCPMEYMPKAIKGFFTFFMPMLVISYYPAAAICGWGGAPSWSGYLAFPAGLCFFVFSLFIWRIGVNHYTSTGS